MLDLKGSEWSHDGISTKALQLAADECGRFPKPTADATSLISSAKQVITLRNALLKIEPGLVSTDTYPPIQWRPHEFDDDAVGTEAVIIGFGNTMVKAALRTSTKARA